MGYSRDYFSTWVKSWIDRGWLAPCADGPFLRVTDAGFRAAGRIPPWQGRAHG